MTAGWPEDSHGQPKCGTGNDGPNVGFGNAVAINPFIYNNLRVQGGGGTGIRTQETLSRPTVFKTAAFNHSAIPPRWASPPLHRTPSRPGSARAGRVPLLWTRFTKAASRCRGARRAGPGYCCSSPSGPGSSSNGSVGSSCGTGSSQTETTFTPLAIFRMSESLE